MKDKKMGRPFKDEEKKEVTYKIRFSQEEKNEAEKKASLKNMKLAEYIRYLIRKDK